MSRETKSNQYVNNLFLYAINNNELYRHYGIFCFKQLQNKAKRGRLDIEASRLFSGVYLTIARNHYQYKIGEKYRMSKSEKELFGQMMYEFYRRKVYVMDECYLFVALLNPI
jgi:hypothetical protein